MTASNSTDRTYLVEVSAYGTDLATYEVEAPNVAMARHYATSMAARDADVPAANVSAYNVVPKPLPGRACVICGTPESSTHTSNNRCCWNPDNIEEV